MSRTLTIAEIEATFSSEWVLIGDPVTNAYLEVLGGSVLFHSKDRDEFDGKSLEFSALRFAVVYTGGPPAGLEFALTPFILPVREP